MAGADEARLSRATDALGDPGQHAVLLRTVVEVARAIFGAKASSVMLYDDASDELVFEAVVGEGEEALLGKRIPGDTGIAGWVLVSQEPLVIEDVAADPRFARDVAERSGYVPNGLMAAPLLQGEAAIGVLSVLDRPRDARFTVAELDLLALFASQAAIALDLLRRARSAADVLAGADVGPLGELAAAIETLAGDERRAAALDLVAALAALVRQDPEIRAIRFE